MFRAHITGAFKAPSEFTELATRKPMRDFFKNLARLRESHWEQAMQFTDGFGDGESQIDESMVSAYRADIYLPSSSPCSSNLF